MCLFGPRGATLVMSFCLQTPPNNDPLEVHNLCGSIHLISELWFNCKV